MKLTRRQFIGAFGALGLGSCARAKGLDFGLGKDGPLTFAAINDLHVLDARSTAMVNRAMDQINATPDVRFTVVIGDVATDGKLVELNLVRESLERLEQPYLVVPGNHDVEPGAVDIYANYDRAFDERTWTRRDDDWLFIGFDSCEGAASDVSIRPDQIAWLERCLKKTKPGRPIALFCHHPFNPNSKAYRVKNADDVLALFSGHNLKLVACGHWHGNQVEERDGILFTTTACCSSTRNNFDDTKAKGYRLFRLDGDTVESEFVEVPA